MSNDELHVSKSAVRRAGSTLRRFAREEATDAEADEALGVIDAYRRSFSDPLNAVAAALGGILRESGIQGEVSQRLKRMLTIAQKIVVRESGLDLSRMQDIGGCRVVLDSDDVADLRRFEGLVCDYWGDGCKRSSNYVDRPRESGYRAIHIVVVQDGRMIEIQLRTQRMHLWAELVESLSGVLGTNYKQDGDSLVQDYARQLSLVMQAVERGEIIGEDDQLKFDDLTKKLQTMLARIEEDLHDI
mgnify:CR=1 FL=1